MTGPAVRDLTDNLDLLAARIERALENNRGRGMSPATAARHARCSTAEAVIVLAWLDAHQYAHHGYRGRHAHYFPGRPR
jgi:hypothetical protein